MRNLTVGEEQEIAPIKNEIGNNWAGWKKDGKTNSDKQLNWDEQIEEELEHRHETEGYRKQKSNKINNKMYIVWYKMKLTPTLQRQIMM